MPEECEERGKIPSLLTSNEPCVISEAELTNSSGIPNNSNTFQ